MTGEEIRSTICCVCQKPIGEEGYYVIGESGIAGGGDPNKPAGHLRCLYRRYREQMYGVDPRAPSDKEHHATLDAMESRGGGFVKALATAWRKADPGNSRKLREAFADYYNQYAAIGMEDAARQKAVKS